MTIQVEPIRGKVARVLNSRDVAINKGEVDGVEWGMKFDILSKAFGIEDPDTGDCLGEFQQTKVRVRVRAVYARMTVAETFNIRRVNVGGSGIGFGMFTPPRWEERYETLMRKDAPRDEISEGDSYIERGDPIVQVIEAIPDSELDQSGKAAQPIP